jgi:N-succinyl-L-ornithine transcarbamylase
MKKFTSIKDIVSLTNLVQDAIEMKVKPYAFKKLGKNKTLLMLFFNPSLRTRLSTQKAAQNMGMNVMIMNISKEGWLLEFEDGSIMNSSSAEHIKEASRVVSQYCDILAIRAFAGLTDREEDYNENLLKAFIKYATIPIISLESASEHPLQALADLLTIRENQQSQKPKVVLTWAPHPKALPQAVANSFVEIMKMAHVDLVITHPSGYDLNNKITENIPVENNQEAAFKNADFIYAKNWSSFENYGKILCNDEKWMVSKEKMKLTNRDGYDQLK